MKHYNKPKVTAVILDPEQAVLEVCKVGGGYFENSVKCVYFRMPGPAPLFTVCIVDVKGVATRTNWNFTDLSEQPS